MEPVVVMSSLHGRINANDRLFIHILDLQDDLYILKDKEKYTFCFSLFIPTPSS